MTEVLSISLIIFMGSMTSDLSLQIYFITSVTRVLLPEVTTYPYSVGVGVHVRGITGRYWRCDWTSLVTEFPTVKSRNRKTVTFAEMTVFKISSV